MSERERFWFFVRVGVLGSVLLVVVLVALRDRSRRSARTEWTKTVSVAVVLVEGAPVDRAAIALFRERALAVEQRLTDELRRYRPQGPAPFEITVVGPVESPRPPPVLRGDDLVSLGRLAVDLFLYRRAIDGSTGIPTGAFDSAVYVVATPPSSDERRFVEGLSQKGGRWGVVQVELALDSTDAAWFVALHELLHTLGAEDRYDATGRTRIPEGLPEPLLEPQFPQRSADLMARGRVVAPGEEVLPDTIDEIAVGSTTAAEIGWR